VDWNLRIVLRSGSEVSWNVCVRRRFSVSKHLASALQSKRKVSQKVRHNITRHWNRIVATFTRESRCRRLRQKNVIEFDTRNATSLVAPFV